MTKPYSECKDDDWDCNELCFDFLNDLSENVRKETSCWLHELSSSDVGHEELGHEIAMKNCTDVLTKIERELGPEHIVCELVMKIMAKRLKKIGMLNCALDLVQEFMERKNSEDVSSLLLLSHIYANSDNCDSAMSMEKAHDLAVAGEETSLLCLVLAKETCNMWNSKKSDEIEEKLEICQTILTGFDTKGKDEGYQCRRKAERLIDIYKTLGYFYAFLQKRPRKSVYYYSRALEILRKDSKSVLRIFQVATCIIRMYSKYSKQKANEYCIELFEEIKAVSRNRIFMTHHSLHIIHFLQDLAYTMEKASCFTKALELHEFAYDIGKEFYGENHPKVVRQAANSAYCCCRQGNVEKETFYVMKAQAGLEYGESQRQELLDAWYTLGLLFSLKENYTDSKKCYKKAIFLESKIYGDYHPRLYRLYRKLGDLYRINEKSSLALCCYKKCKEIRDESSFDKTRTESPEFQISELLDLQGNNIQLAEVNDTP